jgi:DNA-binding XRE family transcriptional regulator
MTNSLFSIPEDFAVSSDASQAEPTTEERISGCVVVDLFAQHRVALPVNFSEIDELAAEFEAEDPRGMADARRWVKGVFYANEHDTLRALRLEKGLSQAKLAQEIGTVQSHIARIERGRDDLHISTCRRLCAALNVDMNRLNQALVNQETAVAQ